MAGPSRLKACQDDPFPRREPWRGRMRQLLNQKRMEEEGEDLETENGSESLWICRVVSAEMHESHLE